MDVALLVLIYNRMGRVKEGSVFDELGQILVNIFRHRLGIRPGGEIQRDPANLPS